MTKEFRAASTIHATPEAIWTVLLDTAHYADWDSGVVSVDGRIAPGATITVVSAASTGRAFPVKVTELTPPHAMTWTGGLPLGLFRGVRTFRSSPQPDGTTTFELREVYSGPLLAVMGRTIPDLAPSFRQFVDGLKRRVEEGTA